MLKGQPTLITVQTHLGQHDMTHVVQLLPDLGGTHVLLLQYPHHTKAQVQKLCVHATSNIANSNRGTCIVHELAETTDVSQSSEHIDNGGHSNEVGGE